MLRWLKPEGSTDLANAASGKVAGETILDITCSGAERRELERIARSRTAGVWRIKRAKIVLGAVEGRSVERLVLDVRVPPESVLKCLEAFEQRGLRYFDVPDRKPTRREARVEAMLAFLENPPPHASGTWESVRIRCIGQDFSAREVQDIRDVIESHPGRSRSELAREVCRMPSLRQMHGELKKSVVTDILKRMDMDNIVALPPPIPKLARKRRVRVGKRFDTPPRKVCLPASDVEQLQFVPVQDRRDSSLWNELIARYHYIGTPRLFGAQLRYLVYGGKRSEAAPTSDLHGEGGEKHLVAALGFCSGAWRLASRDAFIGWTDEQRTANLKRVVNNARFLVLPWIRSENLASRILAGVARQLPLDWERRYEYQPALLETFVQLDRFRGTCYRAANWIEIGRTQGYSLFSAYKPKCSVKAIFVYPLRKNFRHILCGKTSG